MSDTSTKTAPKIIATYARVSTAGQEEEGTIETQISAVKEYANKKGYVIVQEYQDNGWSGELLARPDLDRLRADAKKKLWDAVLIYDPDRLARRGAWQEVVVEELKEVGIDVLYVTVPKAKTDEDVIMQKMRGVFSEYERMKIRERFRLGKVRKARDGHVVTSAAPYGYNLIPKEGKRGDADFVETHYEVNESEARVVRMIFSWIADEGLTIRKVVKRLQELDIKPRKSKKGVWNTSTLGTLLRNKTYIGEGHYGSSYAVIPENPWKKDKKYRKVKKTSRRMKPENEWIKVPTPVLIDEELFERAQAQLKRNADMSQRNRKNEYLLSGLIRCTCGHSRAGEGPQKGKHLYYRCTDRVHSHPLPPKCTEKGTNARLADAAVWSKVSQLISSPELMEKQIERWKKSRGNKLQSPAIDIDGMRREVAKLKKQEDRYARAYAEGLFTLEKLQEYTRPLKEQMTSLESQIAKAQAVVKKHEDADLPATGEIETFAEKARDALDDLSFKLKRGIVINVIEKVEASQRELQVYGRIPVNYVKFETSNRHCRASECGEVNTFQCFNAKIRTGREFSFLYN